LTTELHHAIQLRQADKRDAPILVSILHAAFEEYRGRLDPPSGAHIESVDDIHQKLETASAVIASFDGETAGCVFYEPEETAMYLGRLAVLPPFRRHGIGRALIEYVEEQARQFELAHVHLGVRVALPYLMAYYQGLGYTITAYGMHPGYLEPTYVNMQKELA